MEQRLDREEMQEILEAREAKRRAAEERGAKQLADILNTPQPSSSRRYTFDMFASEEEGEPRLDQEDTEE